MQSIQDLFFESRGQPVSYNGKTIQMVDKVQIQKVHNMELTFESVNSKWVQGVYLSTNGKFTVNEKAFDISIVLWENSAPKTVPIMVESKDGILSVKNVWDVGDGVMESWHNGAAMIVEREEGLIRYLCNDGQPDDDFDDLIFSISLDD